MHVGPVAIHEYEGIAVDAAERERVVRDFGPDKTVMLLRNHGVLACGSTIPMAFARLYTLIEASKIQVLACSTGRTLLMPPQGTAARTFAIAAAFNPEGCGVKEFNALKRLLYKQDPSYMM